MKYFIDTEFLEGFHKLLFGKKRHFIDLISIGIVAEDGREFYAISKDFDLKSAWNKYDWVSFDDNPQSNGAKKKKYWLRENVLKPMMYDLWHKHQNLQNLHCISNDLTFYNLKKWVSAYGKSNKQIAEEIIEFVNSEKVKVAEYSNLVVLSEESQRIIKQGYTEPEFYGYFADYDWVVFCSLFGRMIDLPKEFPMYCIDLKQEFDMDYHVSIRERMKQHKDYPQQINQHNALADAKWNFELYKFLNNL